MVSYDPYAPEIIADPHPYYARLRAEAPAYFVPEYRCWFLSRFEDIWRCGLDSGSFSVADGVLPTQLAVPPSEQSVMRQMMGEGQLGESLALVDPPRHNPSYRSGISAPFKPGAVARLEAFTRSWVRELVDGFAEEGRGDVVGDFAMRTSVRVASHMIGLPQEDAPLFVDWINTHFDRNPGQRGMTEPGSGRHPAPRRVSGALRRSLASGGAAPDTLVGRLFQMKVEGEPLRDIDVTAMALLALIGGTETLPKALSAAVYRLWQHPEQRAEVVRSPALARGAFEEGLRYDMPTQMLGRRVTRRPGAARPDPARGARGSSSSTRPGTATSGSFPTPTASTSTAVRGGCSPSGPARTCVSARTWPAWRGA